MTEYIILVTSFYIVFGIFLYWVLKTTAAQEPEYRTETGYMCGIDWQCELGCASGGNKVYPSLEDCEHHRGCTNECGIVEVQVVFKKWVKPQNFDYYKSPEKNLAQK